MSGSVWKEVDDAKKENRRELVLTGPEISKRIDSSGLDPTIYTLKGLNFLEISRCSLTVLKDDFGKLINMTNLSLHHNKLESLPDSIVNMKKIKFLDLSGNELTELPNGIGELPELESFNVSCNKLERLPALKGLKNLHILDFSHNQMEEFPEDLTSSNLIHVAQIFAAGNQLLELPADLKNLPQLKTLDVSENKLQAIPPEISECVKLKEFNFKQNKLKDRRLGKMGDQCGTKSVMDYLRVQLAKQEQEKGKGKGKSKGKKKKRKQSEEVEDLSQNLMEILKFSEDLGCTVAVTNEVLQVRPYIVCCIVRNLNMTKSLNMMKRFITLQTKLHEGICQKRQAATIATHDLKAVKSPLKFTALIPAVTELIPLFKQKEITAEKLVNKLRQEAEDLRKEKKRNTLSGIHKYLDLLKGKTMYPFLTDADGKVISFPPITNCEVTKVSKESTDILIEVTSSTSLDTCKMVMDSLLQGLLEMGIGTTDAAAAEAGEEAAQEDGGTLSSDQQLIVEQVKITDHEGSLKVIYPSRTDLSSDSYKVVRTWEG